MFDKQLLIITAPSFQQAIKLKRVVSAALNEEKIDLADIELDDISKGNMKSDSINVILSKVLSLTSSWKVEESLMECASKTVYNKQRVNEDFFENVHNRELYFPIMIEVLKESIGPFFQGLFSGLSGIIGKNATTPESK